MSGNQAEEPTADDDAPVVPSARPDPAASREQVLDHFREDIYGAAPGEGWELGWELLREHVTPTGLTRQQRALTISTDTGTHRCVVMADLPQAPEPVPAFLALNFHGNHACAADDAVLDVARQSPQSCGPIYYDGLRESVTLPVPAATQAHRWPAELVTSRGYAAITSCYLQCGPDSAEIFGHGIYPLFDSGAGRTRPPDDWGGIAIWSWLLSRILDALEGGMVPAVDPGRVAALGHSRLGKAALWACAQDDRFAAAISNNSGCMGAAQSRSVGETPEVLARIRPYWFAPRFTDAVLAGDLLPVDQHQLIAAIAPRPVYVASASKDANADPAGELNSLRLASPAWGLTDDWLAGPWEPHTARYDEEAPLGYHLRRGAHEVMPWDWVQWLAFADRWLIRPDRDATESEQGVDDGHRPERKVS